MIGNLKAGNDSASSDIGQVIYRMKMLGFNAIRLPFTFAALAQVSTPTFSCENAFWRHVWEAIAILEGIKALCKVPLATL